MEMSLKIYPGVNELIAALYGFVRFRAQYELDK